MIPSYSEKVNITVQEKSSGSESERLSQLEEQIRLLRETVDYLTRERTRMKNEIESLRSVLRHD
jgi:prefoldin subunit 5